MSPMISRIDAHLALILLSSVFAACHSGSRNIEPDATGRQPSIPEVSESWVVISGEADNVDSVAVAESHGWVIATTKGTHQLLVLDLATGEMIRRAGGPGSEIGQFERPNGIAVVDDFVFVVERDNHRVQVLHLPEFKPLGVIGRADLKRPYGIAAAPSAAGGVDLWVTDNFDWDRADPDARRLLAERIRRYHMTVVGDEMQWQLTATFGDTEGRGAVWKAETIAVDPDRGLLLIAEEETKRMGLLVYTVDGEFTGTVIGEDVYQAEPEGVALWTRGRGGVWVATDQHDERSVFHLFDRESFAHLGAFVGATTANTDGIAVTSEASGRFPSGSLVAVHDDQGVTAFDWERVRRVTELP